MKPRAWPITVVVAVCVASIVMRIVNMLPVDGYSVFVWIYAMALCGKNVYLEFCMVFVLNVSIIYIAYCTYNDAEMNECRAVETKCSLVFAYTTKTETGRASCVQAIIQALVALNTLDAYFRAFYGIIR